MKTKAQRMKLVEKTYPEDVITTTLYDLIEAISVELKADEEGLTVPIVSDLFNSAKSNIVIHGLRNLKEFYIGQNNGILRINIIDAPIGWLTITPTFLLHRLLEREW